LKCLNNCPAAGIVGPKSNYIVPQQAISLVPYKRIRFALEWSTEYHQETYEADYLGGPCMVF
jgi:hypothetical protein